MACEIGHPSGEPPVRPHKRVEEAIPAVETERPPGDHEVKSRAKCAEFDPLRLYVNAIKRRSEEISKETPLQERLKSARCKPVL